MNRYQPSAPRALLAIAALVMTACTLSLSVVVPANMDFEAHPVTTVAAGAGQHTPIQVSATPDFAPSAWVHVRGPQGKRKQQG